MGGRGSVSAGNGERIKVGELLGGGGSGIVDLNESPETRADILTIAKTNTGFEAVGGTGDYDKAVIGAYANRIAALESKYHAITDTNAKIATAKDANFIAAVSNDAFDTSKQTLILNDRYMKSLNSNLNAQARNEAAKFNMPTSGKLTSRANYFITHEYGHMLQNAMYSQAKKNGYTGSETEYARSIVKRVTKIAETKYGGTQKDLSTYGSTNSFEFFAEAFASANSGKPTAVGKAMNDYLSSQGY